MMMMMLTSIPRCPSLLVVVLWLALLVGHPTRVASRGQEEEGVEGEDVAEPTAANNVQCICNGNLNGISCYNMRNTAEKDDKSNELVESRHCASNEECYQDQQFVPHGEWSGLCRRVPAECICNGHLNGMDCYSTEKNGKLVESRYCSSEQECFERQERIPFGEWGRLCRDKSDPAKYICSPEDSGKEACLRVLEESTCSCSNPGVSRRLVCQTRDGTIFEHPQSCTLDVEVCSIPNSQKGSSSTVMYNEWWKACQIDGSNDFPADEITTIPHSDQSVCMCDVNRTGIDCLDPHGNVLFHHDCAEDQACYADTDETFGYNELAKGCSLSASPSVTLEDVEYRYYCLQPQSYNCEITEYQVSSKYNDVEVGVFEVPFTRTGGFAETVRTALFRGSVAQPLGENLGHTVRASALYIRVANTEDMNDAVLYLSDQGLYNENPASTFSTTVIRDTTKITLHDDNIKFGMTCRGLSPLDLFLNSKPGSPYYRNTCEVVAQAAIPIFRENIWYYKPQQNETKQMGVAIISAICGVLSMFGSAFIVFATTYRWRRLGVSSTRDRILLGMSSIDVFSSMALSFGPLLSPEGEIDMIGAVGTTETCSAQGFFIQLGFGVPLYNAMLAVLFLLILGRGWDVQTVARRAEAFFHIIPVGFAIFTSTYGLFTRSFNSNGSFCHIESYPYNCVFNRWRGCERASDSALLFAIFASGPAMAGFLVTTIALGTMSVSIYRQKNDLSRRYGNNYIGRSNDRAKKVLQQAFLYILAFIVTYAPLLAERMLRTRDNEPDWVWSLYRILLPLQGFWNFCIFIRPSYQRVRQQHRKLWSHQALFKAMRLESTDYSLEDDRKAKRMSKIMSLARQSMVQTSNHTHRGLTRSYSFDDISTISGDAGGSSHHTPRKFFKKGSRCIPIPEGHPESVPTTVGTPNAVQKNDDAILQGNTSGTNARTCNVSDSSPPSSDDSFALPEESLNFSTLINQTDAESQRDSAEGEFAEDSGAFTIPDEQSNGLSEKAKIEER